MKKIVIAVLALMVVSTSVFAGGYKPPANSFAGCVQRPYSECAQFGNPWVPIWPEYKIQYVNGNPTYVKNDPAPATFIPLDREKWYACANPIFNACSCKYQNRPWPGQPAC